MGAASVTAHKGKPIWVTAGGPELPVTNIAVAAALALAGPGRISLDSLLGLKVPKFISLAAVAGAAAGVAMTAQASPGEADEEQQEAREELQGGEAAEEA
jgi:putative oxidoreductase